MTKLLKDLKKSAKKPEITDFSCKLPGTLSRPCCDDLEAVRKVSSEKRSTAYRSWMETYSSEIKEYEGNILNNISNFEFLVDRYLNQKDKEIKKKLYEEIKKFNNLRGFTVKEEDVYGFKEKRKIFKVNYFEALKFVTFTDVECEL